jgi:hypothetical protein
MQVSRIWISRAIADCFYNTVLKSCNKNKLNRVVAQETIEHEANTHWMNAPYLFLAVLSLLFPRTACAVVASFLLILWWHRTQH